MNKLFLIIFLMTSSGVALAQPIKGSKAGYSILCTGEQSVGFNWENKKWVKTSFKPNTYLISRVSAEKYANKEVAFENLVSMCNPAEEDKYTSKDQKISFSKACYTFVQMGEKPDALAAGMCSEVWQGNRLTHVHCHEHSGKFAFEYGGDFIRHPWNMDVRSTEQSKDSLAVSVGKCSPIN